MKLERLALWTAPFALGLTIALTGLAEPKGPAGPPGAGKHPPAGKPAPPKAGKGPGNVHGPHGPGGPQGRGPDGPQGRGPGDMHRPGPGGPQGRGPEGPQGRGPEGVPSGQPPGMMPGKGPMMGMGHGPRGARMRMRAERIAALEEKEKSGSLTEDEKAELDKARKTRARFQQLKKKHDERVKSRAERRREDKRKAMMGFPDFKRRPGAVEEFKKHARRVAHLQRARDVAQAAGKDDLVARIDALVAKEQARHERWLQHHRAPQGGPQSGKGGNP